MPARKPDHSYAAQAAFDRLLLLIATLLHHPGVGAVDPLTADNKAHDAMKLVRQRLRDTAQEQGIALQYDSAHTLRKDLKTLRRYGIMADRRYQWGYYLGTGGLTWPELKTALNALRSLAMYQQDPLINDLYDKIVRRLGIQPASEDFIYPVRSHINQTIVYTDPTEMMSRSCYRYTLFEHLEEIEAAILHGQAIEIYRERQAFKTSDVGYFKVWPLQLVYSDIAWYLLCEEVESRKLAFRRLDRFSGHFKLLPEHQRSLEEQYQSMEAAHALRRQGWGLSLGSVEDQKLERSGQQELIHATVRFFSDVIVFIQEGELRHPTQRLEPEPVSRGKKPSYVDYHVDLPPRSMPEFSFWVYKHLDQAQFLAPERWVQEHYQKAKQLVARFED
jgi:hypothetical protein